MTAPRPGAVPDTTAIGKALGFLACTVKSGEEWTPTCETILSEAYAALDGLRSTLASTQRDTALLDALEREVNAEPLLLHVGDAPVRGGYRGLALRPGSLVRTLREALEALASSPASPRTE